MPNPVGSIQIIDIETKKGQKSGKDYTVAQCIVTKADGHCEVGRMFIGERLEKSATIGVFMPTIMLGSRNGDIVPIIVELRPAVAAASHKAAA